MDTTFLRKRLQTLEDVLNSATQEIRQIHEDLLLLGLKAIPFNTVTLSQLEEGNWHFKNPTPEAREVFEDLGVELEEDPTYWDEDHYEYVDWYMGKAYTSEDLEPENEERELIIINGRLHWKP
jgi:hypothetical protein